MDDRSTGNTLTLPDRRKPVPASPGAGYSGQQDDVDRSRTSTVPPIAGFEDDVGVLLRCSLLSSLSHVHSTSATHAHIHTCFSGQFLGQPVLSQYQKVKPVLCLVCSFVSWDTTVTSDQLSYYLRLISLAQDRESLPAETSVLTTMLRHQLPLKRLRVLVPAVPVGTLGSSLTPERTIHRSVLASFHVLLALVRSSWNVLCRDFFGRPLYRY